MKTGLGADKKDKKPVKFDSIDILEKNAPKTVLKNDIIPFSSRRKDLEEQLDAIPDTLATNRDNLEETNYKFTGEEGSNMVMNSNDKDLQPYDPDVSIEFAEYANIAEDALDSIRQIETREQDPDSKPSKEYIALDNLDPVVAKLIQGKNVEEIKVQPETSFKIDLITKVSLSQIHLRGEVLAKLFIIYNKDEYQSMLERYSKSMGENTN